MKINFSNISFVNTGILGEKRFIKGTSTNKMPILTSFNFLNWNFTTIRSSNTDNEFIW